MSDMYTFVTNEIELAKANSDDPFYLASLDAAYEIYDIIEHRIDYFGSYITITMMKILNKLVNSEPLSPIDDTPDVWRKVTPYNGIPTYQCKRYSALFKDITSTGEFYRDLNRFECYDVDNLEIPVHLGLVHWELHKQFPISMPYYPEKWKVYVKEFFSNPIDDDFGTIHIIKAIKPNGEEIAINRYFTVDVKNNKFVEISADRYSELLDKHKEEIQ